MSYSRFALGFSRSRKISRLSDAAFRLWSSAIDYTREQLTDGFLDDKDLQTIPRGGSGGSWKVSTLLELTTAGLWIRVEGGWQIREFLDWQDSAAQVRAQRDKARERMRAVRANKSRSAPEVSSTYSSFIDPDLRSSNPDLETRADATSGVQLAAVPISEPTIAPKTPRNLADSLLLPIAERAAFVEQNRHLAEWVQPEAWPEVRAVAAALHTASGGKGSPRIGKFGNDSGIKRVVELFAAGFSEAELVDVCKRIVVDPWWVADGGKPRSLGALSLEVVRRATVAPGAVAHAAVLKAEREESQLPYHAPAKRQRDAGPVATPQEAKAAVEAALKAMK